MCPPRRILFSLCQIALTKHRQWVAQKPCRSENYRLSSREERQTLLRQALLSCANPVALTAIRFITSITQQVTSSLSAPDHSGRARQLSTHLWALRRAKSVPAGVVEQVRRWKWIYYHVVVMVRPASCAVWLDADWQPRAGWSLASERDIA